MSGRDIYTQFYRDDECLVPHGQDETFKTLTVGKGEGHSSPSPLSQ